jgi:hypothetical protein
MSVERGPVEQPVLCLKSVPKHKRSSPSGEAFASKEWLDAFHHHLLRR